MSTTRRWSVFITIVLLVMVTISLPESVGYKKQRGRG